MIDREFAESLVKHRLIGDAILDETEVHRVIDTVFWASLEKEEASYARPSVTLLHKNINENVYTSLTLFARSLDFSVKRLVKLSPALDVTTSSLAVRRRRERESLEIIGILNNEQPAAFSSLPPHSVVPDALSVRAEAPGSLIITWRRYFLGRFLHGKLTVPPNRGLPLDPLEQRLWEIFECSTHSQDDPNVTYWSVVMSGLKYLLEIIVTLKTGGMLLVIPDALAHNVRPIIEPKYELSHFAVRRSLPRELADSLKAISEGLSAFGSTGYGYAASKYRAQLGFLAHLSAVDGAVCISQEFRPISFAATLKAEAWMGRVVEDLGMEDYSLDKRKMAEVDMNLFGHRHRAAVNIVGACEGIVAFIVSQEGPVRCVTRLGDCVWMWSDYLLRCRS